MLGLYKHLVNHAIVPSLFGRHPVITVGVLRHPIIAHSRVIGNDSVQFLLEFFVSHAP